MYLVGFIIRIGRKFNTIRDILKDCALSAFTELVIKYMWNVPYEL